MGRTISDTAYEILRALFARRGRVVATSEIREAIGKDPHPVLGRDIIGRGWALKWEGFSDLHSPIMATDGIAGAVLTDLGQAAFELGRLERRDEPPEPVGPPELRTGKAADPEWWEANKHLFDFDTRDGGA
jgi:hypothetical protein